MSAVQGGFCTARVVIEELKRRKGWKVRLKDRHITGCKQPCVVSKREQNCVSYLRREVTFEDDSCGTKGMSKTDTTSRRLFLKKDYYNDSVNDVHWTQNPAPSEGPLCGSGRASILVPMGGTERGENVDDEKTIRKVRKCESGPAVGRLA